MRAIQYTCSMPVSNDEIGYIITNGDTISRYSDYDGPSNAKNPSLALSFDAKSQTEYAKLFDEFYQALDGPMCDSHSLDDLPTSVIDEIKLGLQGKSQQWKLVAVSFNICRSFVFNLYGFEQDQVRYETYHKVRAEKDYAAADKAMKQMLPEHVWFRLSKKFSHKFFVCEQTKNGKPARQYELEMFTCDEETDRHYKGYPIATIHEFSRKKRRLKRTITFRYGADKHDDVVADIIERQH